MNRREFVKQGLAASIAVGLGPLSAGASPAPSQKPNVLYIFSDEHRACSLPGEPYNDALAPNLANFAKKNLSFRNCISNYPVCSPYRAMFLTGKWPYQTGIIDNGIQLRNDSGSIGRTFRDNGYYTGYIGKWHLSTNDAVFIPPGPARQGFEDWHVWAHDNPHFDKSFTFDPASGRKIQPHGYNCTLQTDMALQFLQERKAESRKPWLLMLSWNPPHPPFNDAPPEEMKRYDPKELALRPNVQLEPNRRHGAPGSEEGLRKALQGYYSHISAVDREFARVLRALEENGQADNTIVVYTSDHGEMMGSHGYMGKRLPWEESCRVPFLIRCPRVTPQGHETDILFSAVDIYPSLCGLAGVPVPEHCVGKDLSAAMRGNKAAAPESVFLMHIKKDGATGGESNPAPLFRGVRTGRYTYAVAEDGRWCLYDNREDPYQKQNLVADGAYTALMSDLDGLVLDWLKKASDRYPYASLVKRRSALSE
jgi:arylsulfatase A-like enzyme